MRRILALLFIFLLGGCPAPDTDTRSQTPKTVKPPPPYREIAVSTMELKKGEWGAHDTKGYYGPSRIWVLNYGFKFNRTYHEDGQEYWGYKWVMNVQNTSDEPNKIWVCVEWLTAGKKVVEYGINLEELAPEETWEFKRIGNKDTKIRAPLAKTVKSFRAYAWGENDKSPGCGE